LLFSVDKSNISDLEQQSKMLSWFTNKSEAAAKPASQPNVLTPEANATPKCKPCCACPETRQVRDECVFKYGDEAIQCQELIKKHQDCMRSMGFNI
jgi:cytochrome c oxidase assembly protein subunit 17